MAPPPTAAQEVAHLESHVAEAESEFTKNRRRVAPLIRRLHPRFKRSSVGEILRAELTRDDARLMVAREHGFDTWDEIRREAQKGTRARWNLPIHERTDDALFSRAIRLTNGGKATALKALLGDKPDLARRRIRLEISGPFSNPSLLEIAAATHQRGGKVPPNLLGVIDAIFAAHPERRAIQNALNLAAAKPWPANDNLQRRVIRRLIEAGAKPEPAMPRAVFQGSVVALDELVRHGGTLDFIAMAAMGKIPEMKRRLPRASPLERRKALALAAVNGQTRAVQILLDAGVDPNRFNPRGFYEHSTPLHQAVWFGRDETVRLLVERGADLSIRDKAHDGTPLGWATFGKKRRIAAYLRSKGG